MIPQQVWLAARKDSLKKFLRIISRRLPKDEYVYTGNEIISVDDVENRVLSLTSYGLMFEDAHGRFYSIAETINALNDVTAITFVKALRELINQLPAPTEGLKILEQLSKKFYLINLAEL